MDSAKEAQIAAHVQALAALLYEESEATNPQQLETLEGIEVAVREHLQQRVSPALANFLSQQGAAPLQEDTGTSPASSAS